MTSKPRSFNVVGTTRPTADELPPTLPAMSDSASMQASNNGHQPDGPLTYSAASLVAGFPEPRLDLVTVSWRVPRELAQAVDLLARTGRRSRQNIVTDALYEHLPAELVTEVRHRLYPGAP